MHHLPLDWLKAKYLQCILLSDLTVSGNQWPGLKPVYIDPYSDSRYKTSWNNIIVYIVYCDKSRIWIDFWYDEKWQDFVK